MSLPTPGYLHWNCAFTYTNRPLVIVIPVPLQSSRFYFLSPPVDFVLPRPCHMINREIDSHPIVIPQQSRDPQDSQKKKKNPSPAFNPEPGSA